MNNVLKIFEPAIYVFAAWAVCGFPARSHFKIALKSGQHTDLTEVRLDCLSDCLKRFSDDIDEIETMLNRDRYKNDEMGQ